MRGALEKVESGVIRASRRRRGGAMHRGQSWRQHRIRTSVSAPRGTVAGDAPNSRKHDGGRGNLTRVWKEVQSHQ